MGRPRATTAPTSRDEAVAAGERSHGSPTRGAPDDTDRADERLVDHRDAGGAPYRGCQGGGRPGRAVDAALERCSPAGTCSSRAARRGQDAARDRVRARVRARGTARPVHSGHAPVRPDRHDDPARRRARLPPGPGVHRSPARRRDQPDATEDPGGAARGDAGGPGDRSTASATRSRTRSSCSRPRTRSSSRAPTRCPRPSSTASSCRRRRLPRRARPRSAMLRLRHRGVAPPPSRTCAPSSTRCASRGARDVDAVPVTDEVVDYLTAIVRRTRELPSVELGASPRAGVHLLAAARRAARARRPRLRHTRRRRLARGARGARATGSCSTRGRARPLQRRRTRSRRCCGASPVPR